LGVTTNVPLWDGATDLTLPTLDRRVAADVCVVGLGGSGLACVRALLAAGKSVVGIDAVTVAAGAAGRNGGFLLGGLAMFHHDAVERLTSATATAVYEETLKQIDRMAAETPSAVRRTGSLRIAIDAAELEDCARQFEAMHASRLPVERYEGPEGRGLLFPADAVFDPALRCATLARQAIAHGARLFGHSRALAVGDGIVRSSQGNVAAAQIVVAVDGGLERVFPELGGRVRTARLQMLGTAPADRVHWPRPIYSRWGLDYWQQLPDKRIVVGGLRDIGGDAEWTSDDSPSSKVQAGLTTLLRERLGVSAAITHRWAASVGYTQSGLPILEQVRPRVWGIGAYSGTGNVVGALCGRAVAEILVSGSSRVADLLRA
jgi:glycine/D-amino acid oxidase-like deaminating enzyme